MEQMLDNYTQVLCNGEHFAIPGVLPSLRDKEEILPMLVDEIPSKKLYDDFIKILSAKDIWMNVDRLSGAIQLIGDHLDTKILSFIIRKTKGTDIIDVILKNDQIIPKVKTKLINYLIGYGVLNNRNELSFRTIAQIPSHGLLRKYDILAPFIFKNMVNPNFQTDVGNIFHILVNEEYYSSMELDLRRLVDYGCNIFAKNKDGYTPVDLANKLDDPFVTKIFHNATTYKFGTKKYAVEARELIGLGLSGAMIGAVVMLLIMWRN